MRGTCGIISRCVFLFNSTTFQSSPRPTDPPEQGVHALPLHLHRVPVRAPAGLRHCAALQAAPGGPGRVGEGQQDGPGGPAADRSQVHQRLPALPGAGSRRILRKKA